MADETPAQEMPRAAAPVVAPLLAQAAAAAPPPGAPAAPTAPVHPVIHMGVYNPIEGVCTLPAYDLLNGPPGDVKPYLQRSTVPEHLHWALVANVAPVDAFKVVDAFIKSHMYQIYTKGPRDWSADRRRDAAITLGVMRCVMTANYGLTAASFVPGETSGPYLTVSWENGQAPRYGVVASAEAESSAMAAFLPHLTGSLALTADETERVRSLIKCAMGVVPIQGHNLMSDGHHYISDREKVSFKAFLGVEKQLLNKGTTQTWFEADLDFHRDLMWHKAGHPVSISVKLQAATSIRLRDALKNAGVGSAAARLPAVESEARTGSSYVRLCESVRSNFLLSDGDVDYAIIADAFDAISQFPHGEVPPAGGVRVSEHATVRTRAEALANLSDVCKRNAETVAMLFGYYTMMNEYTETSGTAAGGESLSKAYSLRKLRTECIASFHAGVEMYKDYQASRTRLRNAGKFKAPPCKLV